MYTYNVHVFKQNNVLFIFCYMFAAALLCFSVFCFISCGSVLLVPRVRARLSHMGCARVWCCDGEVASTAAFTETLCSCFLLFFCTFLFFVVCFVLLLYVSYLLSNNIFTIVYIDVCVFMFVCTKQAINICIV